MEKERNILITAKDLNDRERNVIETYLKKLSIEISDAIKMRDELQKLVSSEKSMRNAFVKAQIKKIE
jgi:glycine cleavage system pyridoxal-binding protein P